MIPIARPSLPPLEDFVGLLAQVWETRMLSNFSAFATRLEEIASEYLGTSVLAVSSGDSGLMIALAALELPPEAPCYLSAFTFNSTINAAIWNRLEPVLVDIEPDTFNLSVDSLREAMKDARAPGVILPTHVFGNPCSQNALQEVALESRCYLVFDSAHAYGSKSGGQKVGTLGDAEVFSLSGTKLVTSAEGGLVATKHDWLLDRLRYLRGYGFHGDYRSRCVGINGKISELHAALGTLTLPTVEEAVARRTEILHSYQQGLPQHLTWQHVSPNDRSTYKDISIGLGESRMAVERRLIESGVQCKRYFVPLHLMAPYARFQRSPLPVAERIYETTLCLPSHASLTETEIETISGLVLEAL